MNRVKKQLHEWDENLKDDSLPTNVVGQRLFSFITEESQTCTSVQSFRFFFVIHLSGLCQTSPTELRPVCL